MSDKKLPRIPTFAELGIDDDEIEELERQIAEEVAERRRRPPGQGAPAKDQDPGTRSRIAPGDRSRQPAAAAPDSGADAAPAAKPDEAAQPDAKGKPGRERKRKGADQTRQTRKQRRAERKKQARATREPKRPARGDRSRMPEPGAAVGPYFAAAPWGGLRGPLTLVALLLTAWFSSTYRSLPDPAPLGAPETAFSAARAMAHLVEIAQEARPPGSPAHARVRDYLLAELRGLGHEPEVQTATSLLTGPSLLRGATVRNVLARIPGREPGGPAVLVAAHYDSRGISLGAADDGSGVATILEAVRALGSRGQLRNDLIVLLTDAEELRLLGAQAFVDGHPWMDDVALVVNLEMRGGGGPSFMFETGNDNGWVIDAFGQADPRPVANSIGFEIYERLPNLTDFTAFKEAGKQGLNFAAVGRAHVYHQVYDSPGNLSRATLQHHGEHAVAMLQHFGNADLAAGFNAPDKSYVSVPFVGLVTYGTLWITVLGAVAVALWVVLFIAGKRFALRTGAVVASMFASLAYLAIVGAMAYGIFTWRSGAHPELGALYAGAFHQEGWYVLAILCGALAVAAIVGGVLRLRLTAAELATGGLIVPVALAAIATVAFPMAAMNLQWPAIAGCLGAFAVVGMRPQRRMGFPRWLLVLLGAVPVVVMFTPLTEMIWAGLGLNLAAALAVTMGFAFILMFPALEVLREPNGWWAPVGVLMAGGAFLATGISTATPSADRPAPSTLVYAMDRDAGAAHWGTDPTRPDDDPGIVWATSVAGPFTAASAPDSLRGFTVLQRRYAVAPAEVIDVPPPVVAMVVDTMRADRTPRLAVASAIGAEMMLVGFEDSTRIGAVNAQAVPLEARSAILEYWGNLERGVVLDLMPDPGVDIVHLAIVEHHLRPAELVGPDRFRRPSELAPNTRMLSDRAMIRTRAAVDLTTGEVTIQGQAAQGEEESDQPTEPATDDAAATDTIAEEATDTIAVDTIPPPG